MRIKIDVDINIRDYILAYFYFKPKHFMQRLICEIRGTHAYAFYVFKKGDDMNYRIVCDMHFDMLKKIFENIDFYFPKIKYQYDKVLGLRKALELVVKKLDKNYIDIYKLEEDELDLNDYLEAQKLLKDIYEVG